MKNIFLLLCLMAFALGCEDETEKHIFEGRVNLLKVNGEVIEVNVVFPKMRMNDGGYSSVTITDREDVDLLVVQLQSMLKDLEYAKEQMLVKEGAYAPVRSKDEPLP